jgi:malate dehydrogenase (quinone)
MVERYCLQHNYQNKIIFAHQKMALGVGDEECEFMLERYEEFSELFPYLNIYDKKILSNIEPKVVFDNNGRERKENIIAVGASDQWTTVDYGAMAKSFIENAKKEPNKDVELILNSNVDEIKKLENGFELITKDGKYTADYVVVNAGAHSLLLAHNMGYGLDYSTLPMAGSFYITTKKILNGKVYMVQNPKLPFAALHGDPDILADGFTRFGPTALALPKLERYKGGTYLDFWNTLKLDKNIVKIFTDLLKDKDIRNYIFKNFLFEIPFINKKLFLEDAKKIVPSLGLDDIKYAKGFGGVRPQVLNKKEQKLMLGEASINTNEGIVFNMTPSPGATSCLGNALRDVKLIVKYLNKEFYQEKFHDELDEPEFCPLLEPIQREKKFANQLRKDMHLHELSYYQHLREGY